MRTDASSDAARSVSARPRSPWYERDRFAHLHADGEHGVQRAHRVLQDHRHLAAADPLHLALGLGEEILAVQQDLATQDACGRPRHQPDDAEARHALARAGFADEPQRLALADVKDTPSTAFTVPQRVTMWV